MAQKSHAHKLVHMAEEPLSQARVDRQAGRRAYVLVHVSHDVSRASELMVDEGAQQLRCKARVEEDHARGDEELPLIAQQLERVTQDAQWVRLPGQGPRCNLIAPDRLQLAEQHIRALGGSSGGGRRSDQ